VNPETKKPLNNIRKSFATALKKAGIDDFKFHDLRHTFASTLLRSGEPLHKVQRLLGHTTPTMTQRYAHMALSDLKQAIEKIDIQFDNLLYNSKFSEETSEKMDSRLRGNDSGKSGNDSGSVGNEVVAPGQARSTLAFGGKRFRLSPE